MITQDLGIATAYGYAKSKGYTGTEAEFAELMASYASTAQTAIEAADRAVEANTAAQSAKTDASASASTASIAAQTATSKASEAVTAADTANIKASEASTSADTASAAATSAGTSAQTATTAATTATTKASEASESAATATTAKTDAETARDAAAQSASEAAASAESIDPDEFNRKIYAAFATDTATGSIASFPDGADNIPMKDVLVHIEPVQAGSGDPSPDNVRPITGWTGAKVTRCGKNLLEMFGKNGTAILSKNTFVKAGTYTVSTSGISGNYATYVRKATTEGSASGDVIANKVNQGNITFTLEEDTNLMVQWYAPNDSSADLTGKTFQLELGSTATDYEPYSGQTYDITFPSEAGTVYGGTLDVTTGELVVDMAIIASYAGEILPSTWISDRDVYSEGATPTTGAQVCYKLATPITYQLTPQEITSLLGANNLWADTGDSEVEYCVDPTLLLDNESSEIQSIKSMIAGVESSAVATKNYSIGDLVIVGDTLYEVTAAIASGETISVSKARVTTVDDTIKNRIVAIDNVIENRIADSIDATLTQSGQAADAKAVGDEIDSLNSDLNGAMQDLSIITDGDYAQYTPVTMEDWAYVNTIGRIDRHDTKVARTYLLDVSDQPEEIRINVSSDANRARFLYMETPIESVGIGTLGTYVDGGADRTFTLTKANYGNYKTIAINTDYNKAEGDVLGTVSAIKVSKKLIEKVDDAFERVEKVSEGGINVYQAVQMEGWAYVHDAGRISIHPTSGSRTYLIDVSEQPESVQIKVSANANRARFLYMETRIDYVENGTTGTYLDGGSSREFTLTKNDYAGYKTIAINTDYNRGSSSSATYATIEVEKTTILTAVDHTAREAIAGIGNIGKKGCGLFETAATLTDNSIVLCSHIDNKKNASIELWGEIGSDFSKVSVGHGYNVSYSGYAEIDSTNLKWYTSNGTLQKTEPHGLTLSGFVHVLIEQDDNAKATVKVATAGGEYVVNNCTFHGSCGDVFCTVTGVMTNVSLSACFRDLLEDIWYFGDSYVSMADGARWPHYAVQSGHCDFYLNGFGGANSSHALPSLNEALAISTPRIIVWGMGMNNSDSDSAINSTYASILNDVMQICEEKGIELILCTIPNTPTRRHTFKNDFVRASGYRYIDFAKAVGADTAGSTWYDGMLEGSSGEAEEQLTERVHPTVLGAKALYYRLITDVPEMNK